MRGLITDRTQYNIDRLNILSKKKHNEMTDAEKAEWSGDPFAVAQYMSTEVVNLVPRKECTGFYHSSNLKFKDDSIIATSTMNGSISTYGLIDLGPVDWFDGKTITLSVEEIITSKGATPKLELRWYAGGSSAPTGVKLTDKGSRTYTLHKSFVNATHLLLQVYVTDGTEVEESTSVVFKGVMLELGDTKHKYVPYHEVYPTPTIKGAYNFCDLNRIEQAVSEISVVFGMCLKTKTDWNVLDYPTTDEMSRILGNIAVIRDRLTDSNSLPMVPKTMNKITFKQANDIEKILSAVETSTKHFVCSGELFCGEV